MRPPGRSNESRISTWLDSKLRAGDPCRRRIFIGTLDARIIALDASTGKRCAGFDDVEGPAERRQLHDVGLGIVDIFQAARPGLPCCIA